MFQKQAAGVKGLEDALEELNRALTILPSDDQTGLSGDVELLVARVRTLMQLELARPAGQRSWNEVERALAEIRKVAPADAGLLRAEADLKAIQGDLAGAAELLSRAVRQHPRDLDLWIAWASALGRTNQPRQALLVLQQAAAPDAVGDTGALRIARSRLLSVTGNGQQARDLLATKVDKLPRSQQGPVWSELGNQLRQRGQFAEARAAYTHWAALQPGDTKPLLALLELANVEGDRDAATRVLETLKTLGGAENNLAYTVGRVQFLLNGEPTEDQLREANELITELGKDANTLRTADLLRGMYHERRDDPEAAVNSYESALVGGNPLAATRLAVLYTRLGRLDDLEDLRATLVENTMTGGLSGEALDRLSTVALLDAGRAEDAEVLAARLVAGDPNSLDARVWLARVLNTSGKPAEAEKALRDLAEKSNEPGPWLALLAFQVGRKEIEQARDTVDQVRQKVQSDTLDLLLAQCYRMLGDNDRADAAFQDALAAHPENPDVIRALAAFYEATDRIDDGVALLRGA